ncbi:MAG: VWA domain-containing protein [Planctomycetes bacterium]|nr:VWA domain-containing protein [Planctomycetota bacterium]
MNRTHALLAVAALAACLSSVIRAQESGDTDFETLAAKVSQTTKTVDRHALYEAIADLKTDRAQRLLRSLHEASQDESDRLSLVRAMMRDDDHRELAALMRDEIRRDRSANERSALLRLWPDVMESWEAVLGDVARHDYDNTVRRQAMATLAAAKGNEALRQLHATLREGVEPELAAYIIGSVGNHWPVDDLYPAFISPYLNPQAEAPVRQAALRVLARQKDRKFFRAAKSLRAKETVESRLVEWMNLAGGFDSVEALEFMMELLEDEATLRDAAFVRQASAMDSPASRKWFRTRAGLSGHPVLQLAAVKHILAHPEPRDADVLLKLAERPNRIVAAEAIGGLGSFDGIRVTDYLRRTVGHRDPELAAEALRAWWKQTQGGSEVSKVTHDLARTSRAWQIRVVAIDLLVPDHVRTARATILEAIEHPHHLVRSAAYEACTWLRDKDIVDRLIARIPEESGRPLHDLQAALANLTGFDWGVKHDRWVAWWEKVRDEYPLPPRTERQRGAGSGGYARFYDIEVKSDRVLFIVDLSGSMEGKAKSGKTKLQEAKESLIGILQTFNSDVKFNIVVFDTNFRPWGKKLTRATPDAIDKAKTWVENLRSGGATNINDSLEYGLQMDEVDTIFLLSDGAPTAGRTTDVGEIARTMERANRFLRIRINTIGIGLGARTRRFMERLARENYGESRSF